MSKCIYYGEFNAEKYWRNGNLAKLPEIPDRQSENIVKAMDELLFTFCEEDDFVLTRYKMNPDHTRYLKDIGIRFNCNIANLDDKMIGQEDDSICNLLIANNVEIKKLLDKQTHLETFAVLTKAHELSDRYEKFFDSPDIDTIKKVNSKIYSSKLNFDYGLNNRIKIVHSSKELYEEGTKGLTLGDIMIKDSFGVSGKGNLIASSEGVIRRIASFIEKQEKKGKEVEFIVEPLLEKTKDFSSQFKIEKDGRFKFLSVQEVRNTGLSYLGSYTPDVSFMETLEKKYYFDILEKVSKKLYEDGYYGDVCIDSMMLSDGSLYPIVEINARKSMSLMKHNLDEFAYKLGLNFGVTYLNLSYSNECDFSEILKAMKENNVLFTPSLSKGILPLSSNTIFINSILDEAKSLKSYKGRFYYGLLYRNSDELVELNHALISCLNQVGINV